MVANTGLYLLVLLIISQTVEGQGQKVDAYLDKHSVAVGEQFTLSVEISGKGASEAREPELPAMGQFSIFLGSGSSQQIKLINGRMSASRSISFHFQATRVGEFKVGMVQVQLGNTIHKTSPLRLRITDPAVPTNSRPGKKPNMSGTNSNSDLFVRVTADKQEIYQNEALVLSYDIYTRLRVSSYGISKQPETVGFWVENYPLGQQPQTRASIIDGQRYTVALIKKMVLFPTNSGKKTVGPLALQCQVRVNNPSRDPFRNFFSNSFFGQDVTRQISSNEVMVQVLPLPKNGRPKEFEGVVGTFAIESQVDKSQVKANEALTFRVRVSGRGNLATLPEPRIVFPSSFEAYPPKIEQKIHRNPDGITGEKTYEYVLIPRSAGTEYLGPVKLAYFDPTLRTYQVRRSSEVTIQVAPGKSPIGVAELGVSRQEVKLLGQDIRFIKITSGSFRRTGSSLFTIGNFWFPLNLPLLCLLAAFVYKRHLVRMEGDVAYARDKRARRAARKRLSEARIYLERGTEKKFYPAVSRALTGFLADKLNLAEAGMISQEVKQAMRERGISEESIGKYFHCLQTCDLNQFATANSAKDEMRDLLEGAQKSLVRVEGELSSRTKRKHLQ